MITKEMSEYTIMAVFPFDSVRKRMSVIAQDTQGGYRLFCKGADSVMLERINYDKNKIDGL